MKRPLLLCVALFATLSAFCQLYNSVLPVITDFPRVSASAVQTDGKIILAGELISADGVAVRSLVRLNTDGSLDPTFNHSLPPHVQLFTCVLDNDGKIVVGGYSPETKAFLWRLNADGSRDASFTSASVLSEQIARVAALPDGKYLVLHFKSPYISRLNANGSLDTSFTPGTGLDAMGIHDFEIAVQADGKVIVVGQFNTYNGVATRSIVRINTNGSIDNTFQIGTGVGASGLAYSVDLLGDKIILGGRFTSFNSQPANNIVKLNADGTRDNTFASSAIANAFTDGIHEVKVYQESLIIGGIVPAGNDLDCKIIKASASGAIDATFPTITAKISPIEGGVPAPIFTVKGSTIIITSYFTKGGPNPLLGIIKTDGTGSINVGFTSTVGGPASVKAIKKLANGKILIGGKFSRVDNVVANNLALLNSDGTIDTDFATTLGSGFDRDVNNLGEQTNGKLIIGGEFMNVNNVSKSLLVRLNANGSLDNTFTAPLGSLFLGRGVQALHFLASGDMVVGGAFSILSGFNFVGYNLAKLSADGALVPTFNTQVLNDKQLVESIGIQSDESILVTGAYFASDAFLKKLTKDGAVVPGFESPDLSTALPSTLKVLQDDSFLVAVSKNGSGVTFPIIRFSKDGQLLDENSIQADGNVRFIEPLENNNLMVAGDFTKVNGKSVAALARVNLNGTVEELFNYSISGSVETILKDASDGQWYLGGNFTSILQQDVFNLAKIDLDALIRPSDLTATKDNVNGTIRLAWVDRSANETGFRILRSEGVNAFEVAGTVGEKVITYTDNTTLPQKTYHYKVVAYSSTRESDPSNEVSLNTNDWLPPAIPGNLDFEISDNYKTVTLTWSDVSDETSFELERSINAAPFSKIATLQKDILTYDDNFVFETSVHYRLRAVNKFGSSNYTTVAEIPVLMGTEDEHDPSVSVFPNPTAKKVTVTVSSRSSLVKGTLMNAEGKIVHTLISSDTSTDIDMSEMPRGLYYLKLEHGHGVNVMKVVKN